MTKGDHHEARLGRVNSGVRLAPHVRQRGRRGRRRKVFQKCQQRHRIGVGVTNFYGAGAERSHRPQGRQRAGIQIFQALEKSDIV